MHPRVCSRLPSHVAPDARRVAAIHQRLPPGHLRLATGVIIALTAIAAGAAVRFDVFVGYDGYVPQANWFPVICEVQNDGPTFNARFEFSPARFGQGSLRQFPVELPQGTTKRFILPEYGVGNYNFAWEARLRDEKGRVRAETSQQARQMVSWHLPLTAALARTVNGGPVFPDILSRQAEVRPVVARLQPAVFPDDPLALEGLTTIYLHSARALDLRVKQAQALLAWLHNGGHLILAVEQPTQLSANEWLRPVLPCEVREVMATSQRGELQAWLRSSVRFDGTMDSFQNRVSTSATVNPPGSRRILEYAAGRNPWVDWPADAGFETASLTVAAGSLRDGRVLIGSTERPLVITARRGRGQITVWLFDPEVEPFLSWKNRPQFWAKMANLPPQMFTDPNWMQYGWTPLEAVFGAMLESKQIRKLPVGYLLLLLVGYLVIIGPFDRWWLKRINRPMLTWLTFPLYVALFSGLIYLIGYKLRAGESEFNELQVVDISPQGARADRRGRIYGCIYSPSNARYRFVSDQAVAAFREEHPINYGAGSSSRLRFVQKDRGFECEVSVPVWTSQLFVGEWWDQAEVPVAVQIESEAGEGKQRTARVQNRLPHPLTHVSLVQGDRVFDLGNIPAGQSVRVPLNRGRSLRDYAEEHGRDFLQGTQRRQRMFADDERYRLLDLTNGVVAASFESVVPRQAHETYLSGHGFDLTPLVQRGDAVLLAWVPGYTPVKPWQQFSSRRHRRDTLLRVLVPTGALTRTENHLSPVQR